MSADKFREWLKNMAEGRHGDTVDLAGQTGLSQGQISKLLTDQVKGDLRMSTFLRMAEALGRDPGELLVEIYAPTRRRKSKQDSEVVVPIDAKYRKEWDRLFKNNPTRGKRVLENLILQERKGYTDLVSRIVRHIIDSGPSDALSSIGAEVEAWKKSKRSPRPSTSKPKQKTSK